MIITKTKEVTTSFNSSKSFMVQVSQSTKSDGTSIDAVTKVLDLRTRPSTEIHLTEAQLGELIHLLGLASEVME